MNKNTPAKRCSGHEVGLPIDEMVKTLDITEEMILTFLCYLELYHKKFLTVLSSAYTVAKVSSYNGPQGLKLAAQSVSLNYIYFFNKPIQEIIPNVYNFSVHH